MCLCGELCGVGAGLLVLSAHPVSVGAGALHCGRISTPSCLHGITQFVPSDLLTYADLIPALQAEEEFDIEKVRIVQTEKKVRPPHIHPDD